MANISSAFGTIEITIEGGEKSEQLLKNFKTLFDEQMKYACYYTEIGDLDIEDNTATTNFSGCGRWAYNTNIEQVYNWFDDFVNNYKDSTDELRQMWAEINEYDWNIVYDYTDEEGGNLVLYTAVMEVKHKAGEKQVEAVFHSEQDYEYTPENLVELDICSDIEDAKEYCGIEE